MKAKFSLLLLVLGILFGCQQNTSTESANIKEGMIKMAVYYPNGDGKTFDMDYYTNNHMPMVSSYLDESLKAMSIDKGLANGTPDLPVQYLAIGYLYFDNMESFQESMATHSAKFKADVPNYTNIQPVIQISEVQLIE